MDLEPRPLAFVTIDFHVTVECSQECPYCWGPKGRDPAVDTATALRVVEHVKEVGARRIVFTGGDPLKRADICSLVVHARDVGLEVALSTTGDEVTRDLLAHLAPSLDLVSLPIDGSTEEVNARTKKRGHLAAVLRALEWLRAYPSIDVKVCTPVTRHNLEDVPNILAMVEAYARSTRGRVFYNVFQAFPRSMQAVNWESLLVSHDEFASLERDLAVPSSVHVAFLDHETLDRLYVMVFPDGSLVVPTGSTFRRCGAFLEIADLEDALTSTDFDSTKHVRHSRAWSRPEAIASADACPGRP